ncbi:MAG: hypothetical protein HQ580_15780 [Planctomycetes bacterium]|nr:hypothetical protein [Planctomycetota bacterium]
MKLPKTWGWLGFSMIILSLVLFVVWGLGQIFDWLFPGHGGKILFVCLILFPIGIALFGSSETRKALFSKDEED